MKKVGVFTAIAIGAIALLAAPLPSWAGGTVEGKVSFSGKPPAPKEFLFEKFPNPRFCVKNPNKEDRKSTRLNSSHGYISYAVFCLKKKKKKKKTNVNRNTKTTGNYDVGNKI